MTLNDILEIIQKQEWCKCIICNLDDNSVEIRLKPVEAREP